MKYKMLLFAIILTPAFSGAFAQSAKELASKKMIDSIRLAMLSDYAMKYPILRQGFLTADIIGSRRVKGVLNGKDLYEGDLNMTRIRSNFNIPLAQWGKNSLTGSVTYQQAHFETDHVTSFNPQFPATNLSATKATVGLTATYTRADSLFKHPINYSAGISGITDELSGIKRVIYTGSFTTPVMRTKYSALTLGLVVLIDPSAAAPVIPIVSYWHKFKGPDLDLFVDMPYRVALRKQLSKKSWVTAGTELGGSLFFFNLNQPALPQNSVYATLDFRSAATFEYLLTKKLIIGASGGLYTTAMSRMYGQNNRSSDYFFKTSNGSVPYISFSVSFLPFLKSLR